MGFDLRYKIHEAEHVVLISIGSTKDVGIAVVNFANYVHPSCGFSVVLSSD
jgi:hypothetical protein